MKRLTLVALGIAAMACDPPPPAPSTPTSTPTSTSTPTATSASPSPDFKAAGAKIPTPCVLHAGGAKGSASSEAGVHASCWFNAECIASPGQAKRGDGFVDVSCHDRECSCSWRYIDGGADVKLPFTIDAPPTEHDACKSLLLTRCMTGMSIYQHDAGTP